MRINDADSLLDGLSYPLTTSELAAEIGDRELDLPNGTESIGTVFERTGEETFQNSEQAYLTLMSCLSEKAIGRKAYSDRDPPVHGFGDSDPRAMDVLLAPETRSKVDGPHCGICEHVKLVGDWDATAYCTVKEESVEPAVGKVCSEYLSSS